MSGVQTDTITTQVPARLDRLPWSRFHWRVVIGLGGVWVLDGLEVTMVGNVSARLTEKNSGLAINAAQIGWAAAFYITGACLGALVFGQLTDRFGRRKLFMVTLGIYLLSTVATAFAFAPWYFFVARFFTGSGYRRRIRRHQLGHRRIDSGAAARSGRLDHQRVVLAWRGGRFGRRTGAAGHLGVRGEHRVAIRLRNRSYSGCDGLSCAPHDPGKPALVVHSRTPGRRRTDRRGHRKAGRAADRSSAARAARETAESTSTTGYSVPGDRRRGLQTVPAAGDPRSGAVHRASVSLQRRHLQSGNTAERVLRGRRCAACRCSSSSGRWGISPDRCCWGICSTPSAASR